jgi:hypothetical protein
MDIHIRIVKWHSFVHRSVFPVSIGIAALWAEYNTHHYFYSYLNSRLSMQFHTCNPSSGSTFSVAPIRRQGIHPTPSTGYGIPRPLLFRDCTFTPSCRCDLHPHHTPGKCNQQRDSVHARYAGCNCNHAPSRRLPRRLARQASYVPNAPF